MIIVHRMVNRFSILRAWTEYYVCFTPMDWCQASKSWAIHRIILQISLIVFSWNSSPVSSFISHLVIQVLFSAINGVNQVSSYLSVMVTYSSSIVIFFFLCALIGILVMQLLSLRCTKFICLFKSYAERSQHFLNC